MGQIGLQKRQAGEAVAFVDQAGRWARELTRLNTRSPGDTDNAMRAIARTYAIPYSVLWRLRYRRSQIKDIGVSIYVCLKRAYEAECERHQRLHARELEITKAIAGPDCPAVVAATALVGEDEGAAAR